MTKRRHIPPPSQSVPLQSLLRKGIDAKDLRRRADHFARSAQAPGGGAAHAVDRARLHECLNTFVQRLEQSLYTFGEPATDVLLFGTFHYRINAVRTRITLEVNSGRMGMNDFDVGSPMRTFAWVSRVDLGQAIHAAEEQTRLWLRDRVTRFARRHIDGIALRRAVSALLAPCPIALLRARRLLGARFDLIDTPAFWLEQGARIAPLLDEIQCIAPGVMPLVGRLPELLEVKPHGGLLQKVQWHLYRSGVSPADWDRLVKSYPRALWASIKSKAVAPWLLVDDIVAGWCRAHRGLPPEQNLSPGMWLILLRPNGDGVVEALNAPKHWPESPKLIQSAMAASLAARAKGTHETFLEDWARIMRWRANFDGNALAGMPRSFSGALRRAAEDERRIRAKAAAETHRFPTFPLKQWSRGPWMAVDLDTPLAMVNNAIDQAHCGDTLIEECAKGTLRVFSVQEIASNKTIGTIAMERGHELWFPSTAKHFANAPPSTTLVDFAFGLAIAIATAEGKTFVDTAEMRSKFIKGIPGGLAMEDRKKHSPGPKQTTIRIPPEETDSGCGTEIYVREDGTPDAPRRHCITTLIMTADRLDPWN